MNIPCRMLYIQFAEEPLPYVMSMRTNVGLSLRKHAIVSCTNVFLLAYENLLLSCVKLPYLVVISVTNVGLLLTANAFCELLTEDV